MKKKHLIKILSTMIVKFSGSQELLQVKFINCYLREIISFTSKNDIRDWGQSKYFLDGLYYTNFCFPVNSFLANFGNFCGGNFCGLLITFANSLDPDQDRQNVGPDLDPNCLTL